jgi:drug/metabolite transporter (DMT)-like permease
VGLVLALASAFATSAAFLFKQRGAVAAPAVDGRHPLRSAAGLFHSKWWTIGWLVALGAWLLHVGALSLAPLSIVQAVLSGGLVFLAVLADRYFGFHLGRRQWIGLVITAAGLVVVGLTSGRLHGGRSSLAGLIGVECGVLAIGGLLVFGSVKLDNTHRNEGIMLAVAAGALFGVSDVAIKYLTHSGDGGVLALLPWVLAALLAMVVSFYASARSLQLGPGLEVIALTSVAANIVAAIRRPIDAISGLASSVSAHFTKLVDWIVKAVTAAAKGDCSVLHEGIDYLEKAIDGLTAPVLDALKSGFEKVKNFFNGIWERFGAPLWEKIKEYAGAAWEKVEHFIGWIREKIQPLIDKVIVGWRRIKRWLGIGDDPDSQDGLLQWAQRKIEGLWEKLKAKLEQELPIEQDLTRWLALFDAPV